MEWLSVIRELWAKINPGLRWLAIWGLEGVGGSGGETGPVSAMSDLLKMSGNYHCPYFSYFAVDEKSVRLHHGPGPGNQLTPPVVMPFRGSPDHTPDRLPQPGKGDSLKIH